MTNMPFIQDAVNLLSEQEQKLCEGIIGRGGRLKTARPIKYSGEAQYIWRMLAFYLVDRAPYVNIPVMADFYVYNEYPDKGYSELHKYIKESLEPIITKILNNIPIRDQRGLNRWSKTLL